MRPNDRWPNWEYPKVCLTLSTAKVTEVFFNHHKFAELGFKKKNHLESYSQVKVEVSLGNGTPNFVYSLHELKKYFYQVVR